MKIVLRAFGGKLSGVMEVPEETGPRFRLALIQPIQAFTADSTHKYPLMSGPLETICEFEYTGMTFSQKGHNWDGAREYQLTDISKR
jgi:hypothetical protein